VVWAQGKLWRVAVASGKRRRDPVPREGHARGAQGGSLPDGRGPDRFDVKQLRWVNGRAGRERGRLLRARPPLREGPASGTPRRLTKADDRFELYPSLSRDGARVAFVTWNDDSAGSVRTLELRTGKETC
jgi:hypothetical protein